MRVVCVPCRTVLHVEVPHDSQREEFLLSMRFISEFARTRRPVPGRGGPADFALNEGKPVVVDEPVVGRSRGAAFDEDDGGVVSRVAARSSGPRVAAPPATPPPSLPPLPPPPPVLPDSDDEKEADAGAPQTTSSYHAKFGGGSRSGSGRGRGRGGKSKYADE